MATARNFVWIDAQGQQREQTADDTLNVANGVLSTHAVNKGQLDSVEGTLTDLINTESTRALQAEAALGDALAAETANRVAGDAALQASLTAETNSRTSADTALGGRIDTEEAARIAADSAESAARTAADSALRTDLDAEIARATAAEAAEQAARIAADSDLQDAIDAEEAARIAAVSAEEAARIAADAALQSELDAEEARAQAAEAAEQAARIAADNALQTAIDDEETRAVAAEAALQADIDAEEARAIAAEGVLTAAIAAEQSRAQTAEANLQSDIDAEEARAIAREDEIEAALDAEIARATSTEAANLQEAKDYADARAQGASWKQSVDYAFPRTGAYTLPADAASLIEDESLAEGARVLIYGADQGAHVDHGVYVVSGTSLVRASDMAAGSDAAGAALVAENYEGSLSGDALSVNFVCSNKGTAIVGTDALQFVISNWMEALSFSGGVQKVGTAVSAKVETGKPVYVNGSNELTFRIDETDLSIDGAGNLLVDGPLVGGQFTSADAKHTHEALSKVVTSAQTVGVFVTSDGSAATYDAPAVFGCVDAKDGSDARVVYSGLSAVASGALSAFADDDRVYLGSAAGVFSNYADVPSGKWAVPVGFKRGSEIQVQILPATQKA